MKKLKFLNVFLFTTLLLAPLVVLMMHFAGTRYSLVVAAFVAREVVFLYPLTRIRKFDYFEPVIFTILMSPLVDYRILYLLLYQDFFPDFSPSITEEAAIRCGSLVLFYQAIAWASLYAGYYSRLPSSIASRLPVPLNWPWGARRFLLLVCLFTTIGIGCYLFVTISMAGNPLRFVKYVEVYKRQYGPYWTLLRGIYLLSPAAIIWYCYHLTERRTYHFWIYFIGIAAILGSLGQRSNVLLPLFVLLILSHYLNRPLQPWKVAGFAVFVIVLAVVAQDVRLTRYQSSSGELSLDVVRTRRYAAVDLMNDWIRDRRSFDTFVEVVRQVPDEIDLQYGKSYMYFLVMPIPRLFWPGKVDFLRENVVDDGRIVDAPQPPGFFSGLYLNFYVPGLIIGAFLWGLCLKALYIWLKSNQKNRGVVLIYVITLALLSGGPTPLAISTWLNYLIPVVLAIRFLGIRPQQQSLLPVPVSTSSQDADHWKTVKRPVPTGESR